MSKLSSASEKVNINIVMVGHVDAGKSTISGHLLYLTGMLDERTLEKFARESEALGRSSWKFAWAMDLTNEERDKGKTHEVGQAFFETDLRRYTLLDAPGHRNFVPNMIGGATQAEVAILVISARKGEFEAGFERGGQSREHAVLVRSGGARHLIVAVNKMDECDWSQTRFDEIKSKVSPFLKTLGFNMDKDVSYIPIAGLSGVNLKQPLEAALCEWYRGPTLLGLLDSIEMPRRQSDAPLRIPISSAYREGEVYALGKVESGQVAPGDTLILLPNRQEVKVLQVLIDSRAVESALAGDIVRLKVSLAKGFGEEEFTAGSMLCDLDTPCTPVARFQARINVLESDSSSLISAGFACLLHLHTLATTCEVKKILGVIDKKAGGKLRRKPFVKAGQTCDAEIELPEAACVEVYKSFPQLGRFVLREDGATVGIGVVTSLHCQPDASDAESES